MGRTGKSRLTTFSILCMLSLCVCVCVCVYYRTGSFLPDVSVQLPTLRGEDIDQHFRRIAEEQSEPYLQRSLELAKATLPPVPKKFSLEPGWTRYDGKEQLRVDYPSEDALVLDVEVCVPESPRPILAAAVSETHWYTWVSQRLVSGDDYYSYMQRRTVASEDDLIPLESRRGSAGPATDGGEWQQRVVVGHNVSYDRARLKEQYLIKVGGRDAGWSSFG